jgi:hypothetical protein
MNESFVSGSDKSARAVNSGTTNKHYQTQFVKWAVSLSELTQHYSPDSV